MVKLTCHPWVEPAPGGAPYLCLAVFDHSYIDPWIHCPTDLGQSTATSCSTPRTHSRGSGKKHMTQGPLLLSTRPFGCRPLALRTSSPCSEGVCRAKRLLRGNNQSETEQQPILRDPPAAHCPTSYQLVTPRLDFSWGDQTHTESAMLASNCVSAVRPDHGNKRSLTLTESGYRSGAPSFLRDIPVTLPNTSHQESSRGHICHPFPLFSSFQAS
ncbi:hypothetical protein B0H63DRAFT_32676 [Podospora didyma]|uniref:Uncharacterized protein n=1 Tax=Podospora didyma TaxID=330526 RepID=A0AAE0U7U6_9PEZI|nr:hypothetical protein B0H63DRAFT_32676 [Podospora didyma]